MQMRIVFNSLNFWLNELCWYLKKLYTVKHFNPRHSFQLQKKHSKHSMASTSKSTVYYEDVPAGALDEKQFFCSERIVPRKIKPQNIVLRLRDREIYGSRKPGSHFHVAREFYQNVFPNLTIVNVEKPPCFLRKFSPDGKHFIAFSADQTSLEVSANLLKIHFRLLWNYRIFMCRYVFKSLF